MSQTQSDVIALDLRCDVAAPSRVRDALSRLEGLGSLLADAMLVATELVTNALRHSGCTDTQFIHVRVRKACGRLFISVADPGHSGLIAHAQHPPEIGSGGLGLWLIEQIARRWGAERFDGYRVWAELTLA